MQWWGLLWFYVLAPACNVRTIMLYTQGTNPRGNTTFADPFMG